MATLPAVAMADPPTTTTAEMLAWLSLGALSPAPADMASLRALGLALAPSFPGLIAMLALSLARRV